jgi:hypothetical protein
VPRESAEGGDSRDGDASRGGFHAAGAAGACGDRATRGEGRHFGSIARLRASSDASGSGRAVEALGTSGRRGGTARRHHQPACVERIDARLTRGVHDDAVRRRMDARSALHTGENAVPRMPLRDERWRRRRRDARLVRSADCETIRSSRSDFSRNVADGHKNVVWLHPGSGNFTVSSFHHGGKMNPRIGVCASHLQVYGS